MDKTLVELGKLVGSLKAQWEVDTERLNAELSALDAELAALNADNDRIEGNLKDVAASLDSLKELYDTPWKGIITEKGDG